MRDRGSPLTKGHGVTGKRLYGPEVLMTYFALFGLPVGVCLYALNVARRGQPVAGYLLSGLAAVTEGLLLLAPEAPWHPNVSRLLFLDYLFLGFFVGLGVLRSESGSYRIALGQGAIPARWWPPVAVALALEGMAALSR